MGDGAPWEHDATLHAWWVEPGRLLAGEYPGSRTHASTVAKVRALVAAGVESIDLTTPADHLDSYQAELALEAERARRSIHHFEYPIPDMGVVDQKRYDDILARIRDEMEGGRTVYVHCWGGKGRTSTVIGCHLIDEGLAYDRALKRIADLRVGTRKAKEPCPESAAQHRVLRERSARRTQQ